MVTVTCEKYTASVEAKGPTQTLYIESLSLILEGFKLIRHLDNTLYESTKFDIFKAILDGKLDEVTTSNEDSNGQDIRIDLNGVLNQMKEEEGDN